MVAAHISWKDLAGILPGRTGSLSQSLAQLSSFKYVLYAWIQNKTKSKSPFTTQQYWLSTDLDFFIYLFFWNPIVQLIYSAGSVKLTLHQEFFYALLKISLYSVVLPLCLPQICVL